MLKYAVTDNLYLSFQNGKDVFKHMFMPNPPSGKNSATRLKDNNNFLFPYNVYRLFDRTMDYYYDSLEKI